MTKNVNNCTKNDYPEPFFIENISERLSWYIYINESDAKIASKIAYQLGAEFEEQRVTSLGPGEHPWGFAEPGYYWKTLDGKFQVVIPEK